jgi:hypothetical protein
MSKAIQDRYRASVLGLKSLPFQQENVSSDRTKSESKNKNLLKT